MNHSICAVVPVYNAEKTLEPLVTCLTETLSTFRAYHIVLVDDKSTDASLEIMHRLHGENPHITAISLARNTGQQSALLCGLRHAECDYTVILDDDLEHSPEDIPKLYERIVDGFDAVYGVNMGAADSHGRFRSTGARLRDWLMNRLTDKPRSMKVCSFRMMNRDAVQHVCAADTRFVYISLELLKHTANISNVPVHYNARTSSGYHPLKLAALMWKMIVYYSCSRVLKPLRKRGQGYEIESIHHARSSK